jgi:hypothetical protein
VFGAVCGEGWRKAGRRSHTECMVHIGTKVIDLFGIFTWRRAKSILIPVYMPHPTFRHRHTDLAPCLAPPLQTGPLTRQPWGPTRDAFWPASPPPLPFGSHPLHHSWGGICTRAGDESGSGAGPSATTTAAAPVPPPATGAVGGDGRGPRPRDGPTPGPRRGARGMI